MSSSSPAFAASSNSSISRRRRLDASAVLRELEQLHNALKPGDAFPSRRDLFERLDAPEHILRDALNEFERQGKIIRRVGRGGSIVVKLASDGESGFYGDAHRNGSQPTAFSTPSRTLVVIAEPDGSIFDRAVQLLARHPQAADIAINCKLMAHEDAVSYEWPSSSARPLGFLLLRRHLRPLAQKLQGQGHRVVLMGSPSGEANAGVPNVYGDRIEGTLLILRHLMQLGHRRFLCQWNSNEVKRVIHDNNLKAYFEPLEDSQLEAWGKNPRLARDYFLRPDAPTALLAWNDETAIRLLTLLNRAELRVPEDVSLIGYDDLPQGAHIHPALSTVDSAIERQLTAALRLLTQEQVPPQHHSVVIMPTLVARESSAKPRN